MNNRIWNCRNPNQGDIKKVLCVCSAGLLRSPTAAKILYSEYGYNTRSVGLDTSHALIPIDDVLITWADEIVCMTLEQEERLKVMVGDSAVAIKCLHIEDDYRYMDPKLIELIKANYQTSDSKVEGTKTIKLDKPKKVKKEVVGTSKPGM